MGKKNISTKIEAFYKNQSEHHKRDKKSTKELKEIWSQETVDFWRHERMRNSLLPLIERFPKSNWLTIGDGKYGTEANFLKRKGLKVHASDIQTSLLKIGKREGFIEDFSLQNAEDLSFNDNSFDFVYCKESYHHFPRPAIAVYEMLRVAKKGIILQEPVDRLFFENMIQAIFFKILEPLRKLIRSKKSIHKFEESGNYVYTLSPRELQKYALGLGYRCIAYKIQQDYYKKGMEEEKCTETSKLFKNSKRRIYLLESLYKFGLPVGGIITGVILKEVPHKYLIKDLKKDGFKVEILPQNPYL